MNKRRVLLWIVAVCLLAALIPSTVFAASKGWVQNAYGKWSYYGADGQRYEYGVYEIGGKYYGFDTVGNMYENTQFTLYDHNTAEAFSYRAKADGSLYVDSWYQDADKTWYYYGAGGNAATDFTLIKGTWYFFQDGKMITDEFVWSARYQANYYIGIDGTSSIKAPKTGWLNISGEYYYFANNTQYISDIYQIGGKYYGFNGDGKMYANTAFEMYGNFYQLSQYRAKADGSLYVDSWYQDGDEWYYYGAAGKGAKGFTQINGKQYYFEYACMVQDRVVYVNGKAYAFDKNGIQIQTQGKHAVGGSYVYVQADGTVVQMDWVQISGKWHYFEPNMVANTIRQIDGKLYAADNAGVCVAVTGNGIYDIGTSGKVYLESGKVSSGWKQVGGSWYYFNPSMYKNDVYKIEDTYYVFDQNGKLYTGGWILLGYGSEWYGEEGFSYAYADASGKAATGLKTIGGKQYIFNNNGYMYDSTAIEFNGVEYVIDESGVATRAGEGWNQVDGKWYYVKNGKLAISQMLEIGGKRYAFGSNGEMVTNKTAWISGGYVLAGADGVVKTGWQKYGGEWYYAGGNGYLLCESKQFIGGKAYIFDYNGVLRIGTFWYDGKIITTDNNGVVISEKDSADGWTYVAGQALYYKNGQRYDGWVGDYLIDFGVMWINTYGEWKGDYYAFDTYGKYVKSGWHRFDYGSDGYSAYVYAKPGGKLCYNEWYAINGSWYYFDGVYMLSGGIYEVEGELCKFDDNGKYLGKATAFSGEGWKQDNGKWYYIHAGKPVEGVQWINGERYVFDCDGVMLSGGFVFLEDPLYAIGGLFNGEWYYTDSDGTIPNYTGWKKLNGEWCYFNSNNMPVTGWFQDNGKVYFGKVKIKNNVEYVAVATGYLYSNGDLQYFGADGVYQGTAGIENGWYEAGGEWYYFRNGKAVNGYQVIDGKNYFFASGAMQTDVTTYRGYYGTDGVQRLVKGWYKTSEGWIYVKDDGTLCNGVQKIGDKEYYFVNYVMIR